MASRKDLKVTGLSRCRYRELKYFCLQYPEWKEKLGRDITAVKSVGINDMPSGNGISDNTQNLALRRIEIEEKCRIIEQAVHEADEEIAPWILKNVTLGIPYEYLNVPCGRRKFYEVRISFFNILDKMGN